MIYTCHQISTLSNDSSSTLLPLQTTPIYARTYQGHQSAIPVAHRLGLMHDDDVEHLYFDNHENMTQQESADLIALLTIRPAVQETS